MDYTVCQLCNTKKDDYRCSNTICKANIHYKLKSYTDQFASSQESFEDIITHFMCLLKDFKHTIYMTGIGKSAYIINKCVATWQSLGIKVYSLLQQDLLHGDLGILQTNDIIIYVSNSGNTEELVNISGYIKNNFNVTQICITNNPSAKIMNNMTRSFVIGNDKIEEADILNLAPSVSSVLFMALLDLIGIQFAEIRGITKQEFKRFHPGGDLGKT